MPFYIPFEQAYTSPSPEIELNELTVKNLMNDLLISLKNPFDILVFGGSRAGKTTLGKFISGERGRELNFIPKSNGFEVYNFEPLGRKACFTIMPGQKVHEVENVKRLQEAIAREKPFGFINVVCYGYQFREERYECMIASGKTLEDYLSECREQNFYFDKTISPSVEDYLKTRREEEIDLLKAFSPYIVFLNQMCNNRK